MFIRTWIVGVSALVASCGGSTEPISRVTPVTPVDTTTPNIPFPAGPTGWVAGTVSGDGLTNQYQVFVPANYDPKVKWPVILFQHDGTSRGTDNTKQLTIGLGPIVKAQQATWKAITIFPQTGTNEPLRPGFLRVGPAALDSVRKHYNVDPTRIYLTGISSGAIFSYEILFLHPDIFAAFVPISADICGLCIATSSTPQRDLALMLANKMPTMGYWQWHGGTDSVIPVQDARDINAAWKTINPLVKYTEEPGVGHGQAHLQAYDDPALWTWLFAQHR
ncbi:MAG: hypothetical protein ABI664_11305 [bacterium]